jgi:hypothetical protein
MRELDLKWSPSTLISVEWNALTYAGRTVWNRHTPKSERGSGRPKRRPREEWITQQNTHTAFISDIEAAKILGLTQEPSLPIRKEIAQLEKE